MPNYQNLRVWNEAVELAVRVYRVSRDRPAAEKLGLTPQARQAARQPFGANIAEGTGSGTDLDFRRFLRIATGSVNEAEH